MRPPLRALGVNATLAAIAPMNSPNSGRRGTEAMS